jgi:hypothetical protein
MYHRTTSLQRAEKGANRSKTESACIGEHIGSQLPTLSFSRLCSKFVTNTDTIRPPSPITILSFSISRIDLGTFPAAWNHLRIMSDYLEPAERDDWVEFVNWDLDDPDWAAMHENAAAQAR